MTAGLVPLVPVARSIVSSYGERPLADLPAGRAPQDVADALAALCAECPWLRVTELWRSYDAQAQARARYEAWDRAGRPARGSAGWDGARMKDAFVAAPGRSMHNAGRAIDVWVDTLAKHYGPDDYLDEFWAVARRHGFVPVIDEPREGASESWHFDHPGPWRYVRSARGYETMALCAALVVGEAGAGVQTTARVVQAHLLRLGDDVGHPDGLVGPRTRAALERRGLATLSLDLAAQRLAAL